MIKYLVLPIFLLTPLFGMSDLKDQMKLQLSSLEDLFENLYAPKEWKQAHGWDLHEEIESAKAEIDANDQINLKNYYKILNRILDSTSDFHVGAEFYSTEYSKLPFQLKSAEGRCFVTYVADPLLQISSGDEIVAINNRPVQAVLDEFQKEAFPQSNIESAKALAEYYFTFRMGSAGLRAQKGVIRLDVRSKGSKKIRQVAINWKYKEEKVAPFVAHRSLKKGNAEDSILIPLVKNQELYGPMLSPYYLMEKKYNEEAAPFLNGNLKSELPSLGKVLVKFDENPYFQAYLFESPLKKKVGFIRIPSFSYFEEDSEEAISMFQQMIRYFESNSSALVIDQRGNPGGNIEHLYAILSMLTKSPLAVPFHKIVNTQREIHFYTEILEYLRMIRNNQDAKEIFGETFCGEPVTLKTIQRFIRFYEDSIEEWNNGHSMTKLMAMDGIEVIEPASSAHYSKPIVVLIDPLDFSCADFFAAILQDNGRALLFGEKTAGAGGFVRELKFPNLLGVRAIHYTGSIAERMNGEPIENLGVTPDIPYSLKASDLTDGYSSYAAELIKVVEKL